MLTEAEIVQFIETDKISDKKRMARKGQDYYEAVHDIKDYKLYYINADGKVVEDKNRSNIKIAHPFFTELVDQEVQYMLSGDDSFIQSDDEQLQKQLDIRFGDDFRAELQECLTGCVSKGFEHMYGYMGADGVTHFMAADSLGVVEVRAKDTQDNTDYVIYWYPDRIAKDNKIIERIQVWDANNTWYYVREQGGKLLPDTDQPINPRPHIVYQKMNDEALYTEGNGGYGFIPFFRLDNNRKQISGLNPIKDLIDDYDLMACGLSNNLQDISEGIYVVKGFQGQNLDEMIQNIKTKKVVGTAPDGDVDIRTINIPYQARVAKLDLDEKNIYRFGMGFNSAQLGDGNITNIVIKSRYALLDLKCNKLEISLKQFLRKMIKVALDEINKASGTDYQQSDVYFDFDREVMTNAQDNATIELTDVQKQAVQVNMYLSLQQAIGDDEMLKLICDCLDIDYDDVKASLPPDEEAVTTDAQQRLDQVQPDDAETDTADTGEDDLGGDDDTEIDDLLNELEKSLGGD